MNVKCKNCNNDFYIFADFFKSNSDISCPYCDAVLPKKYMSYVENAFNSLRELNYQIRSRHEDGICDLFEFSVEDVFVPIEKFKYFESE